MNERNETMRARAIVPLMILKSAAKADVLHVPCKGGAAAVADLVGGQVRGMFADLPVLHGQAVSGRLRPIVVTGAALSPVLPEVPTATELGCQGVQAVDRYGILVPATTPRDVVGRLHDAIARTMSHPDPRQKLAALGAEVSTSDPDRFQAFLRDDLVRWGAIAKASGAKID